MFTTARFCILALMTLVGSSQSRAADPPSTVSQLIAELDADRHSARRSATHELVKQAEALPAVIAAQEMSSLEVRERAAVAERSIRIPQISSPSRVSFAVLDEAASKVLEKIAELSGNTIILGEEFDDSRISVSFSNTPFWEAVLRVCELTANSITDAVNSNGWQVQRLPHHRKRFAVSGPALAIHRSFYQIWLQNLAVGAPLPAAEPGIGMYFEVLLEPRFAAHRSLNGAYYCKASGDNGEVLAQIFNDPPQFVELGNGNSRNFTVQVSISRPDLPTTTLQSLEFLVPIAGHDDSVTVEFDGISGETREAHGMELVLDSVRYSDDEAVYGIRGNIPKNWYIEALPPADSRIEVGTSRSGTESWISVRVRKILYAEPSPLALRVYRFTYTQWLRFAFEEMNIVLP